MLYRPSIYLRRAYHHEWQSLVRPTKPPRHQFHNSARVRQNDSPPNHYETLELSPHASPTEIKKQFYTLSKRHHPDLHPTDPNASARFVAIITAYTTLSNPTARARYDASVFPASSRSGSYSSSSGGGGGGNGSGPAGARPASGLSKRRGAFRGPPPSFYRSGGWGTMAGRKGRGAGARSHPEQGSGSSGGPDGPGAAGTSNGGGGGGDQAFGAAEGGSYAGARGAFGAGQAAGANGGGVGEDDIPYWDRAGHLRTQRNMEGRRERSMGAKGARRVLVDEWGNEVDGPGAGGGGSLLKGFLVLTGVVAGCVVIPNLVLGAGTGRRREEGRGRAD
ncbi:MAG: hypothetical protein M1821_006047 [Bathelium mastoideum]|nr:MAG: hypothetical protein M1821_006047 [Bathelium mastoideum]